MGGACGLRVGPRRNEFLTLKKTIDSIVKMSNLFGREVFSGERFSGMSLPLFDTDYKMAISVQTPMLKVNYFI